MDITCSNCNTMISFPFDLDYKYYSCYSCQNDYKLEENSLKFIDKQPRTSYPPELKIGSKGVFDNVEYFVVNCTHRLNSKNEKWFEYKLTSPSNKTIFLIEDCGHWIIEKEIDSKDIKHKAGLFYKDVEYKKYEVGKSKEFYRCGFFSYKLDKNFSSYEEYINPPFCISVENDDAKKIYYQGEHINQKQIKDIFKVDNLRFKDGVGLAQPFYYNLTDVFTIFVISILTITLLHIFFYSQNKEQLVYQNTFDLNQVINKEIYSDVFSLKGPIAPLSIDINSDVDNSWMTTDFALINQETNETVYFTKDLEYYHGYSEGENWTEGSNDDEFNICGVSEGLYKIMILPSKDETDLFNSSLKIKIYWGKPNNWNLYVTIFAFIIMAIILLLIKNSFESTRWEDSYYSPYKKD